MARFKQAVVFRVFTDVGGVVPPMKRTDEALANLCRVVVGLGRKA